MNFFLNILNNENLKTYFDWWRLFGLKNIIQKYKPKEFYRNVWHSSVGDGLDIDHGLWEVYRSGLYVYILFLILWLLWFTTRRLVVLPLFYFIFFYRILLCYIRFIINSLFLAFSKKNKFTQKKIKSQLIVYLKRYGYFYSKIWEYLTILIIEIFFYFFLKQILLEKKIADVFLDLIAYIKTAFYVYIKQRYLTVSNLYLILFLKKINIFLHYIYRLIRFLIFFIIKLWKLNVLIENFAIFPITGFYWVIMWWSFVSFLNKINLYSLKVCVYTILNSYFSIYSIKIINLINFFFFFLVDLRLKIGTTCLTLMLLLVNTRKISVLPLIKILVLSYYYRIFKKKYINFLCFFFFLKSKLYGITNILLFSLFEYSIFTVSGVYGFFSTLINKYCFIVYVKTPLKYCIQFVLGVRLFFSILFKVWVVNVFINIINKVYKTMIAILLYKILFTVCLFRYFYNIFHAVKIFFFNLILKLIYLFKTWYLYIWKICKSLVYLVFFFFNIFIKVYFFFFVKYSYIIKNYFFFITRNIIYLNSLFIKLMLSVFLIKIASPISIFYRFFNIILSLGKATLLLIVFDLLNLFKFSFGNFGTIFLGILKRYVSVFFFYMFCNNLDQIGYLFYNPILNIESSYFNCIFLLVNSIRPIFVANSPFFTSLILLVILLELGSIYFSLQWNKKIIYSTLYILVFLLLVGCILLPNSKFFYIILFKTSTPIMVMLWSYRCLREEDRLFSCLSYNTNLVKNGFFSFIDKKRNSIVFRLNDRIHDPFIEIIVLFLFYFILMFVFFDTRDFLNLSGLPTFCLSSWGTFLISFFLLIRQSTYSYFSWVFSLSLLILFDVLQVWLLFYSNFNYLGLLSNLPSNESTGIGTVGLLSSIDGVLDLIIPNLKSKDSWYLGESFVESLKKTTTYSRNETLKSSTIPFSPIGDMFIQPFLITPHDDHNWTISNSLDVEYFNNVKNNTSVSNSITGSVDNYWLIGRDSYIYFGEFLDYDLYYGWSHRNLIDTDTFFSYSPYSYTNIIGDGFMKHLITDILTIFSGPVELDQNPSINLFEWGSNYAPGQSANRLRGGMGGGDIENQNLYNSEQKRRDNGETYHEWFPGFYVLDGKFDSKHPILFIRVFVLFFVIIVPFSIYNTLMLKEPLYLDETFGEMEVTNYNFFFFGNEQIESYSTYYWNNIFNSNLEWPTDKGLPDPVAYEPTSDMFGQLLKNVNTGLFNTTILDSFFFVPILKHGEGYITNELKTFLMPILFPTGFDSINSYNTKTNFSKFNIEINKFNNSYSQLSKSEFLGYDGEKYKILPNYKKSSIFASRQSAEINTEYSNLFESLILELETPENEAARGLEYEFNSEVSDDSTEEEYADPDGNYPESGLFENDTVIDDPVSEYCSEWSDINSEIESIRSELFGTEYDYYDKGISNVGLEYITKYDIWDNDLDMDGSRYLVPKKRVSYNKFKNWLKKMDIKEYLLNKVVRANRLIYAIRPTIIFLKKEKIKYIKLQKELNSLISSRIKLEPYRILGNSLSGIISILNPIYKFYNNSSVLPVVSRFSTNTLSSKKIIKNNLGTFYTLFRRLRPFTFKFNTLNFSTINTRIGIGQLQPTWVFVKKNNVFNKKKIELRSLINLATGSYIIHTCFGAARTYRKSVLKKVYFKKNLNFLNRTIKKKVWILPIFYFYKTRFLKFNGNKKKVVFTPQVKYKNYLFIKNFYFNSSLYRVNQTLTYSSIFFLKQKEYTIKKNTKITNTYIKDSLTGDNLIKFNKDRILKIIKPTKKKRIIKHNLVYAFINSNISKYKLNTTINSSSFLYKKEPSRYFKFYLKRFQNIYGISKFFYIYYFTKLKIKFIVSCSQKLNTRLLMYNLARSTHRLADLVVYTTSFSKMEKLFLKKLNPSYTHRLTPVIPVLKGNLPVSALDYLFYSDMASNYFKAIAKKIYNSFSTDFDYTLGIVSNDILNKSSLYTTSIYFSTRTKVAYWGSFNRKWPISLSSIFFYLRTIDYYFLNNRFITMYWKQFNIKQPWTKFLFKLIKNYLIDFTGLSISSLFSVWSKNTFTKTLISSQESYLINEMSYLKIKNWFNKFIYTKKDKKLNSIVDIGKLKFKTNELLTSIDPPFEMHTEIYFESYKFLKSKKFYKFLSHYIKSQYLITIIFYLWKYISNNFIVYKYLKKNIFWSNVSKKIKMTKLDYFYNFTSQTFFYNLNDIGINEPNPTLNRFWSITYSTWKKWKLKESVPIHLDTSYINTDVVILGKIRPWDFKATNFTPFQFFSIDLNFIKNNLHSYIFGVSLFRYLFIDRILYLLRNGYLSFQDSNNFRFNRTDQIILRWGSVSDFHMSTISGGFKSNFIESDNGFKKSNYFALKVMFGLLDKNENFNRNLLPPKDYSILSSNILNKYDLFQLIKKREEFDYSFNVKFILLWITQLKKENKFNFDKRIYYLNIFKLFTDSDNFSSSLNFKEWHGRKVNPVFWLKSYRNKISYIQNYVIMKDYLINLIEVCSSQLPNNSKNLNFMDIEKNNIGWGVKKKYLIKYKKVFDKNQDFLKKLRILNYSMFLVLFNDTQPINIIELSYYRVISSGFLLSFALNVFNNKKFDFKKNYSIKNLIKKTIRKFKFLDKFFWFRKTEFTYFPFIPKKKVNKKKIKLISKKLSKNKYSETLIKNLMLKKDFKKNDYKSNDYLGDNIREVDRLENWSDSSADSDLESGDAIEIPDSFVEEGEEFLNTYLSVKLKEFIKQKFDKKKQHLSDKQSRKYVKNSYIKKTGLDYINNPMEDLREKKSFFFDERLLFQFVPIFLEGKWSGSDSGQTDWESNHSLRSNNKKVFSELFSILTINPKRQNKDRFDFSKIHTEAKPLYDLINSISIFVSDCDTNFYDDKIIHIKNISFTWLEFIRHLFIARWRLHLDYSNKKLNTLFTFPLPILHDFYNFKYFIFSKYIYKNLTKVYAENFKRVNLNSSRVLKKTSTLLYEIKYIYSNYYISRRGGIDVSSVVRKTTPSRFERQFSHINKGSIKNIILKINDSKDEFDFTSTKINILSRHTFGINKKVTSSIVSFLRPYRSVQMYNPHEEFYFDYDTEKPWRDYIYLRYYNDLHFKKIKNFKERRMFINNEKSFNYTKKFKEFDRKDSILKYNRNWFFSNYINDSFFYKQAYTGAWISYSDFDPDDIRDRHRKNKLGSKYRLNFNTELWWTRNELPDYNFRRIDGFGQEVDGFLDSDGELFHLHKGLTDVAFLPEGLETESTALPIFEKNLLDPEDPALNEDGTFPEDDLNVFFTHRLEIRDPKNEPYSVFDFSEIFELVDSYLKRKTCGFGDPALNADDLVGTKYPLDLGDVVDYLSFKSVHPMSYSAENIFIDLIDQKIDEMLLFQTISGTSIENVFKNHTALKDASSEIDRYSFSLIKDLNIDSLENILDFGFDLILLKYCENYWKYIVEVDSNWNDLYSPSFPQIGDVIENSTEYLPVWNYDPSMWESTGFEYTKSPLTPYDDSKLLLPSKVSNLDSNYKWLAQKDLVSPGVTIDSLSWGGSDLVNGLGNHLPYDLLYASDNDSDVDLLAETFFIHLGEEKWTGTDSSSDNSRTSLTNSEEFPKYGVGLENKKHDSGSDFFIEKIPHKSIKSQMYTNKISKSKIFKDRFWKTIYDKFDKFKVGESMVGYKPPNKLHKSTIREETYEMSTTNTPHVPELLVEQQSANINLNLDMNTPPSSRIVLYSKPRYNIYNLIKTKKGELPITIIKSSIRKLSALNFIIRKYPQIEFYYFFNFLISKNFILDLNKTDFYTVGKKMTEVTYYPILKNYINNLKPFFYNKNIKSLKKFNRYLLANHLDKIQKKKLKLTPRRGFKNRRHLFSKVLEFKNKFYLKIKKTPTLKANYVYKCVYNDTISQNKLQTKTNIFIIKNLKKMNIREVRYKSNIIDLKNFNNLRNFDLYEKIKKNHTLNFLISGKNNENSIMFLNSISKYRVLNKYRFSINWLNFLFYLIIIISWELDERRSKYLKKQLNLFLIYRNYFIKKSNSKNYKKTKNPNTYILPKLRVSSWTSDTKTKTDLIQDQEYTIYSHYSEVIDNKKGPYDNPLVKSKVRSDLYWTYENLFNDFFFKKPTKHYHNPPRIDKQGELILPGLSKKKTNSKNNIKVPFNLVKVDINPLITSYFGILNLNINKKKFQKLWKNNSFPIKNIEISTYRESIKIFKKFFLWKSLNFGGGNNYLKKNRLVSFKNLYKKPPLGGEFLLKLENLDMSDSETGTELFSVSSSSTYESETINDFIKNESNLIQMDFQYSSEAEHKMEQVYDNKFNLNSKKGDIDDSSNWSSGTEYDIESSRSFNFKSDPFMYDIKKNILEDDKEHLKVRKKRIKRNQKNFSDPELLSNHTEENWEPTTNDAGDRASDITFHEDTSEELEYAFSDEYDGIDYTYDARDEVGVAHELFSYIDWGFETDEDDLDTDERMGTGGSFTADIIRDQTTESVYLDFIENEYAAQIRNFPEEVLDWTVSDFYSEMMYNHEITDLPNSTNESEQYSVDSNNSISDYFMDDDGSGGELEDSTLYISDDPSSSYTEFESSTQSTPLIDFFNENELIDQYEFNIAPIAHQDVDLFTTPRFNSFSPKSTFSDSISKPYFDFKNDSNSNTLGWDDSTRVELEETTRDLKDYSIRQNSFNSFKFEAFLNNLLIDLNLDRDTHLKSNLVLENLIRFKPPELDSFRVVLFKKTNYLFFYRNLMLELGLSSKMF